MKDKLGDRIKEYERRFSHQLNPYAGPIIARLDGRAFSKFTKNLNKPFDYRFCEAMWSTVEYLMTTTHPIFAYTQSDEISLVYEYKEPSQAIFGGKLNKINSLLASATTVAFYKAIQNVLPERARLTPQFDCRTFQVKDRETASDVILWRFLDAKRNAINSAARVYFSHKELNGKSTREKVKMLAAKSLNFEHYPNFFRLGSFFFRKNELREFTPKELVKFPVKYQTTPCIRSVIVKKSSNLDSINLVNLIFKGNND